MALVKKYAPWALTVTMLIMLLFAWQYFRTELQKMDSELTSLKSQYNQLVVTSNAKLQEVNEKYQKLVDETNQKIQLASLPEVQVSVSFRKALLNAGNVAMIKNNSGQTIAISVEISRPASYQSRRFDLTLDHGRSKEIGAIEGWAFVPGDIVTIQQAGHKEVVFAAP